MWHCQTLFYMRRKVAETPEDSRWHQSRIASEEDETVKVKIFWVVIRWKCILMDYTNSMNTFKEISILIFATRTKEDYYSIVYMYVYLHPHDFWSGVPFYIESVSKQSIDWFRFTWNQPVNNRHLRQSTFVWLSNVTCTWNDDFSFTRNNTHAGFNTYCVWSELWLYSSSNTGAWKKILIFILFFFKHLCRRRPTAWLHRTAFMVWYPPQVLEKNVDFHIHV